MKNFLTIIPARGGSKGVPKKNIKKLNSHPLIAYSIAACKMSKQLEKTIISTDDNEIADIAKKYGGNVPFLRPSEISGDYSHDKDFLIHAAEWYKKEYSFYPEAFCIIRPTTPLREPKIIDKAIEKFANHPEATSLVSIHECPETPAKMFGLAGEYLHGLSPFDPRKEYFALPRQNFPKAYVGNGYIDIVRYDIINQNDSFYGERMLAFETPDYGEVDIESDFKKLEFYASQKNFEICHYLEKLI
jgi:CMP-N,N'-diacetyllegionaminic acid synthase|tara:strand:+ start:1565 stop:2299 length:735 start_codon:yes stop_codon:yes gene_type:complete